MADDQLRDLVEGFRTRVQTELDAQVAALTSTHDDMIERARQAAEAEAEQRWAGKLTAVHADWDTRLKSEVAAARGEAERRLVAETMRVRVETEQAAAESAADLRREMEQAIAAERERAAAEREQADAEREQADADRKQAAAEREQADADRKQAAAERERADAERREAERALDEARASLEEERRLTRDAIEQARRAGASRDLTHLLAAIAGIDAAASLSDILTAVVHGAAAEAPRASLFVVNGHQLDEWTAPGHAPLSPGPIAVDARDAGLLADVLRRQEPVSSATGADGPRVPVFAADAAAAVAVPFVMGGRTVAVLYADDEASGGEVTRGWEDIIQILGRHAAAAVAYLTAVRTADAIRLVSTAATSASQMTAGDDEQGARRYARLLVSEIKLYNETAVRTGREKRDLLKRLAPEIDRARRLYAERVPDSMRARDFYFQQELVQTLAGGDASLLG